MREILFRGKRIDNGRWEYGAYVRYGFMGKEKPYIVPSFASALYANEVDPETVGQFTGLTDKNGKKIFEGDIVKVKGFNYPQKVVYNEQKCCYEWISLETDFHFGIYEVKRLCEVVGNIYDNPELLGESNEHH